MQQTLRSLTVETKDKPHVKMRGMTRHITPNPTPGEPSVVDDRMDSHYIPVLGYDDMTTIDINEKQLGWIVTGYEHLDKLPPDAKTGRMRTDVMRMKQELDTKLRGNAEIEAQIRAQVEAELRVEMAAKAAAEASEKAAAVEPKTKAKKETA